MLLRSITDVLEKLAPPAFAESWDNVGLLTGDPQQKIHRILFTIDYTPAVAAEGKSLGCDLIVAYHPPLFSAIKRITADGPSAMIHDAIRRGVAIYSPHTAWDVAPGGSNDFLAGCLGLVEVQPLRMMTPAASAYLKLVTFVPEGFVDIVSDALFNAGAGHIGKYSSCSFRAAGLGTFLGEAGTHPAIGQPGRLETTAEFRLETVVRRANVEQVIGALRKAHPYEEVAFDLTVLAGVPVGNGQGRIGDLPGSMSIADLVDSLKEKLNLDKLLVSGEEKRSVQRAAVCAGSGGELLDDAIARGAELFLTGELRHHDALKATRAGMTTICTLHSNSERPSLMQLKSRLEKTVTGLPEILLSGADRDPFVIR